MRPPLRTGLVAGAVALATTAVALAAPGPPRITGAAALSNTDVRVRFSEAVVASAVTPADFLLEMGGRKLTPTGVSVAQDGLSAVVVAPEWEPGTAGFVGLKDGVPDAQGEQAAQPMDVRVMAAPGDFAVPRITKVALRPRTVCLEERRGCAGSAILGYTLSERVTATLSARRSGSRGVSKVSISGRKGANRVRIRRRMKGLSLRPGLYRLAIGARDASGNAAPPRKIRLRVKP